MGGGSVWVSNSGDDDVLQIDPVERTDVDEIPVGSQPTGIAHCSPEAGLDSISLRHPLGVTPLKLASRPWVTSCADSWDRLCCPSAAIVAERFMIRSPSRDEEHFRVARQSHSDPPRPSSQTRR